MSGNTCKSAAALRKATDDMTPERCRRTAVKQCRRQVVNVALQHHMDEMRGERNALMEGGRREV